MSTMTVPQQTNKLHPHKLLMYIAIGSMTMMFAGWISAFMVREGQGRWDHIQLPSAFYISTALIVLSSITVYLATRAHRNKNYGSYKLFLIGTIILGAAFISFQINGFSYMYHEMGILLNGNNAAGEFTYVIPFVHGLHLIGGIVALLIMLLLAFWGKNRKNPTSSRGIEIAATYWHFVDALWLFIFIFLLYNQQG